MNNPCAIAGGWAILLNVEMSVGNLKQRECSVEHCSKRSDRRVMFFMHYYRGLRGDPTWTKREQFIIDNPPRNGVGRIPLSNGRIAHVDAEDYPMLISFTWHYAVRKS